ncbi:imidazole glycerol phosphate synthase subunit HisF [Candidatus Woesearchaeota archaeon]|jgi:imidazole glycerol-phosphate synthase subunit HisF|nr:imidazole glycerol phosphate synthase subunit HisF [Candidatus Woesearchaeota archaeon]
MLKKRLIPKLQMKVVKMAGSNILALVNTINFDKFRVIGDPISQAKIFQSQSADELIFLNLDSKYDSNKMTINIIKKVSEEIFMPVTVGGGVSNIGYVRELLKSGADKVSINTAAIENNKIISDASNYFGSQCVVISIDYKKNCSGKNVVVTHGGSKMTTLDPIEWAKKVEKLGAGEILLTSIDNDGMHNGLDLETTKTVSRSVSIPVISSGGCGKAKHFIDGFLIGKADAIAAGGFFSYKDQNQVQTRAQIFNSDIPVRLQA